MFKTKTIKNKKQQQRQKKKKKITRCEYEERTCSAKICPLISNKPARSIPGPRGFAPIKRAHSTSSNTS
jgi:hypothetical protein